VQAVKFSTTFLHFSCRDLHLPRLGVGIGLELAMAILAGGPAAPAFERHPQRQQA
jgi:hypothetical protein